MQIELNKRDVVSIVGFGGKTTLLFKLARELVSSKVLVSTTTKMFLPNENQYDFIFIDEPVKIQGNGIYFAASRSLESGKVSCFKDFYETQKQFDYVLMEADGSKGKFLKAWDEHEPVIVSNTTKTIGVVNLKLFGCEINESNIHRVEIFCKITNANIGDEICVEHYQKIIEHRDGLFKNSCGEKIVYFISDSEKEKIALKRLMNVLGGIKCIIA